MSSVRDVLCFFTLRNLLTLFPLWAHLESDLENQKNMRKVFLLNRCPLHGARLATSDCSVLRVFECWLSPLERIPRVIGSFLKDLRTARLTDMGNSLLS